MSVCRFLSVVHECSEQRECYGRQSTILSAKNPSTHLIGRWMGSKSLCGRSGEMVFKRIVEELVLETSAGMC